MLAKINKSHYDTLKDEALVEVCFKHIIPLIQGKNMDIKMKVYKELTPNQQSLFMFCIYFNHAIKSAQEFFWWTHHYINQPKVWKKIKDSITYYNGHNMVRVMEEMEADLIKQEEHNSVEILAICQPLYQQFQNESLKVLKNIGESIRQNSTDYIEFVKN